MTNAKEIIVLILGWLTGVGVTLAGVLIPNLQAYLLPTGIAIMITTLGLDIGFNFIPHAKANIAERKLELEKLSTEKPLESVPKNATIKTVTIEPTPSLAGAIKGLVEAITPEKEVEETKDDFPLSSQ